MSTIQPQQQPEQQSQPQPQQQQQPVLVYPNTVTKQPPNSHHSNGSFGTVFIVLAIIVVISAIACFLGRLCNRRAHNSKPKPKPPKQSSRAKEGGSEGGNGKNDHHNKIRPKERSGSEFGSGTNGFRQKEGDLEFGFDMRSKPSGFRSDSRGHGHAGNGFRSGSRGHGGDHGIINGGGGGDMKVEMKHGHVDEGGLRASA